MYASKQSIKDVDKQFALEQWHTCSTEQHDGPHQTVCVRESCTFYPQPLFLEWSIVMSSLSCYI